MYGKGMRGPSGDTGLYNCDQTCRYKPSMYIATRTIANSTVLSCTNR